MSAGGAKQGIPAAAGWKVARRNTSCAACERTFAPGDIVVSSLHELPLDAEDEGFARRDSCESCFSTESADGPELFFWWRNEIPVPEKNKAVFDLGVAREFLLRLLQDADPSRAALRYLLTLMLMRKRIARVEEQFTDERGEIMVVRLPPSETLHEIHCPELGEEETLQLRDEIGRLFDIGGDEADDEPTT